MHRTLFLALLVATIAAIGIDFTSANNGGMVSNNMNPEMDTAAINAEIEIRRLKGSQKQIKQGDEERGGGAVPVAAFTAGLFGARSARVRAEQLAKQSGKLSTQTSKLSDAQVSAVVKSAARKGSDTLKLVLALLMGTGMSASAIYGIISVLKSSNK